MRLAILLASLLMLSACTDTDADARRVFQSAFATEALPNGVVPLNGYLFERRRYFVLSDQMWRLHLGGPGAKEFVKQRWPDLRADMPRSFVQGSQTPWFAPGRDVKYTVLVSPTEPITVMYTNESDEVFIAYDGL